MSELVIPLGSVVLGEKLGSGGYGDVFKARMSGVRRDVAVKVLNPSAFQGDPGVVRARFLREADLLMDLRHARIPPIYGIGEFEGKPFIVMEYFAGYNLHQARETSGSPKPVQALPFMEYCADALGYAHQRGVIHRDVKPTNLLTRRGDARVVDFGIAHIVDPSGERLTRTGGTPVGDAFAAPELLDDPRRADPRCDIYSLGAAWYWLLTGTTPRGRSWEEAIRAVDGMTPEYEAVIFKTLEQVEKRYQTMEALIIDLRALQEGSRPGATDDGLDDDAALVLGVIFEQSDGESPTAYKLEQELSGRLTRFALAFALKMLRKRGLLEDREMQEGFNEWIEIALTREGEEWVMRSRRRVEKLLSEWRAAVPQAPEVDDEIPF